MGNKSNTTENQVKLGDRVKGKIELPKFDPTPFIGKEVKIESVTENEGEFGYYVKIATEVVTTLGENDIRATRILSISENSETGELGWNDDTDLGAFLNKMKVSHYNELVGKTVKLQTKLSKDKKQEFLSF